MADPRTLGRRLAFLLTALLLHLAAGATDALAQAAQASIAGVVRDASGAVLPGVTVEAASPALIEKVRTVTTDGAGQYRIEQLRTGTYAVTFSLAGFSTVKRDGVELTGSFSATVNADLRVGTLEETVTVTGASPIVDVQSATKQRVIDADVLAAIPNGRTQFTAATLIPGMNLNNQDVGGTNIINTTGGSMTIHGSNGNDQRVMIDGLSTANCRAGRPGQQLPAQHGQRPGSGGGLLVRHGRPGHRRRPHQHHPARGRQQLHRVTVRHRRDRRASRPTTTPTSCRPAACARPTR